MPAVLPQQHPANDYVREQHEMKQGKLHIGFSTPVRFGDADFSKMQIFNGIFGGYPHAKLFMNVREKRALLIMLLVPMHRIMDLYLLYLVLKLK